MSAPPVRPPGRLARWAHVLSFRTISGKLIIGLVVLFGLASALVSLVTAQSLSNSLMSSLNGQLQSATSTWLSCANSDNHGPGGGPDNDYGNYQNCYNQGQAQGTFLAVLSSDGKVEQFFYVSKSCTLTVADKATLAEIPAPHEYQSSDPPSPPGPALTYTRTLPSLGVEFMFTRVLGPGDTATTLVTGVPLT